MTKGGMAVVFVIAGAVVSGYLAHLGSPLLALIAFIVGAGMALDTWSD